MVNLHTNHSLLEAFSDFHALYMNRFEGSLLAEEYDDVSPAFNSLPSLTIAVACFDELLFHMIENETYGLADEWKNFAYTVRSRYCPCIFCGNHVDEYDLSHRIARQNDYEMDHHYHCFFMAESVAIRTHMFKLCNARVCAFNRSRMFMAENDDQDGLFNDTRALLMDLLETRFSLSLEHMGAMDIAMYQILFTRNFAEIAVMHPERLAVEEIVKIAKINYSIVCNGLVRQYLLSHDGDDFELPYKRLCEDFFKCRIQLPSLPVIDQYSQKQINLLLKGIQEQKVRFRNSCLVGEMAEMDLEE